MALAIAVAHTRRPVAVAALVAVVYRAAVAVVVATKLELQRLHLRVVRNVPGYIGR